MVLVIFCGVIGATIGSFLNVVVSRVPQGLSVVRPGSACPSCHAAIAPADNVPVVSWLLLGGRCRHCRRSISLRYPAIELLTAGLFAGMALRFGDSWTLPAMLVFSAGLVALGAIDLDRMLLPRRIVYICLAACSVLLAVATVAGASYGRLGRAALCAAVAWVAFAALHLASPRSLGFGDVRLAPVLGLCLGWLGAGYAVLGFVVANLLGALVGVALMLGGKADRKTAVPYGVFLAAGALLSVLAGGPLLHWYHSALH